MNIFNLKTPEWEGRNLNNSVYITQKKSVNGNRLGECSLNVAQATFLIL